MTAGRAGLSSPVEWTLFDGTVLDTTLLDGMLDGTLEA